MFHRGPSFGLLLCLSTSSAHRLRNEVVDKTRSGFPEELRESYPLCSKKLDDLGLTLNDLVLTKEEVSKLFESKNQCSWWTSHECSEAHAARLVHEYFLRTLLVGQADPRGPTLYTPAAQNAAVETIQEITQEMLRDGRTQPDVEFMTRVFQGINVEDTGSVDIAIINAFAAAFNRGSGETLYRTKEVRTRPYDLTKWGEQMEDKIPKYNNLTYSDADGRVTKALELSSWGFGQTSFVYKFPPQGIKRELRNILAAFNARTSSMKDVSTMVVFEMAEQWIRDLVILHPFVDSNGRAARVSLNILLLLNGLSPVVMERQDEDMSSSQQDLKDRICEGMAYAKGLFMSLEQMQHGVLHENSNDAVSWLGDQASRCCSADDSLDGGTSWCVTVPIGLHCDKYAELTQSMRYLPWQQSNACGGVKQDADFCPSERQAKKEIAHELQVAQKPKLLSLEEIRLSRFKEDDAADKKAGKDGTTVIKMALYRLQSYSFNIVRDSNLASDIGELVFMASYFHGNGALLEKQNEMILKHEMTIKIAKDEARAERHYVKFNDDKPDPDPKVYGIDTVGVQRGNKHFWVSLPRELNCGLLSDWHTCAWRDWGVTKAIHTACLLNTVDDGLQGTQKRFSEIYKKFKYPRKGGGEEALDATSKVVLKLYRRAFEQCKNVWTGATALKAIGLPEKGEAFDNPANRCCCFNDPATDVMPTWAKDGVCLEDVGARAVFAETWSMVKVPEQFFDDHSHRCYPGMALYRPDPGRGRCLHHHTHDPVNAIVNASEANYGVGYTLGGNASFDNAYPSLRYIHWAKQWLGGGYWAEHEFVCDSDIGMHHKGPLGCDCTWAGDQCPSFTLPPVLAKQLEKPKPQASIIHAAPLTASRSTSGSMRTSARFFGLPFFGKKKEPCGIAFDFDRTLAIIHVFHRLAQQGALDSVSQVTWLNRLFQRKQQVIEQIMGGVDRLTRLQELLYDCKQRCVGRVYVISHGFTEVVREALSRANLLEYFDDVLGNDSPRMEAAHGDKSIALKEMAGKGVKLMLVDDDERNTDRADQLGISTVLVLNKGMQEDEFEKVEDWLGEKRKPKRKVEDDDQLFGVHRVDPDYTDIAGAEFSIYESLLEP